MAFKIKKKPENSGRNQKKKKNTVKGNGGKVVRNVFLVLAGVLVIGGIAFGVHEWKNIKDVAERTSFDSDEAGRINGESVSMAEFMVYSIDVKNGYEAQYGNSSGRRKPQMQMAMRTRLKMLQKKAHSNRFVSYGLF